MTSPSHRLGAIQLDEERLAADLAQIEYHGFVDSYTEFVCGTWRTCMLWNPTGNSSDSTIRDFEGQPRITEYGRKLGYVEELMHENFDMDLLRFARVTRLVPGTVVVPHRDYLELDRELVRMHVPLETVVGAYTSEEETIYRMGRGEVWFLDASKIHSIANFAKTNRTHLLLDFHAENPHEVFRHQSPHDEAMPPEALIPRRPLRAGERETFLGLSKIIDQANFSDVMATVIKRYFVAEIDVREVFAWLAEIAAASGDDEVIAHAQWIEKHSISSREA